MTARFFKNLKILTLAALVLLVLPSFSPNTHRAYAVSYNPPPADFLHAPLSSMGLTALTQAMPAHPASPVNQTSSSLNTLPGQSISQNSLRFINDSSYMPQSETSLAVDPNAPSHVVGGFNDLRLFFCGLMPADCPTGFAQSLSGFTVSTDGGGTVLKGDDLPGLNTTAGYLTPYGDPTLASAVDGNFFYASLARGAQGLNGIMLAKSNGNLFSTSVSCTTSFFSPWVNPCWTAVIVYGNFGIVHGFEDKPLIAVDQSESKFSGSVYVAWDHFSLQTGTSSSSLARCDNRLDACTMLAGGTNAPLSGSDAFVSFTTPVVDKKGNVYVAWCNYGTPDSFGPVSCKIRSSPPGGTRFGDASNILSFMGPGTTLPNFSVTIGFATEQFRTASVPALAVDTSGTSASGNLYFTIQVCTAGRYYSRFFFSGFLSVPDNPGNCGLSSIVVSKSTNGGLSWSFPGTGGIVSRSGVNIQPWVTVDPATGEVFVVHYTTQFDPFNHRIDVVAERSTDGGNTFPASRQVRVTSVSDEPDSDPNMFLYLSAFGGSWSAPQFGDYFQAVALGGTLWVLFTGNYAMELGTFQTDPFLAKAAGV